MNVSSAPTRLASQTRNAPPASEPPQKEQEIQPDRDHIADRYNVSRSVGNYTSGISLGAAKEAVTTTVQAPRLAWEIAENLWQAETIGPNLKLLGTLAAIPAAVLSIPAGPFYGAYQGWEAVHSAEKHDGSLLTQDTSAGFAANALNANESGEPRTMTGHFIKSLEELGDAKLAEGQKPHDVPILSPVFSLLGGVVSGALSGVIGLVAGFAAGTITTGKEMAGAITADDLSAGKRIEKFVAAPLNMLVMGPALAWSGIKESVPRGFVDGWNHGPFKPVIDSARITGTLAGSVIKEAWEHK